MKWKTFWQIVLLMIIAGALFYLFYPRYYFSIERYRILKADKFTGKVMVYDIKEMSSDKWEELKSKKEPKIDFRPIR